MFFTYAVPLLILFQTALCCEQEGNNNAIRRASRSVSDPQFKEKIIRSVPVPQYAQENNRGYTLKEWLKENYHFGQVSGVTIDDDGLIYVFHRAERVWSMITFNNNNEFQQANLGPILRATILIFHSNGTLINARGKGMFYIPHGIFVDKFKNVWVTDVALHQVMKLHPDSDNSLLTLGTKFIPGQDTAHFCKPTSVSVLRDTNDFFVADGYCNYRILKYNSKGVKLLEWGRSSASENGRIPGHYEFFIPHAMTLVKEENLVCVADRQNGRVLCYNTNNGTFSLELSNPSVIGSLIYSVAYSSAKGGQFFLVNGPYGSNYVQGFVVSRDNQINSAFGGNYFILPHDIAVSNDSSTVYVAELNPPRISKFMLDTSVDIVKTNESSLPQMKKIGASGNEGKLTGAVLITSSCFVFAAAIIIATFIYSRNRKPGCGRCHHNFWILKNGAGEGFKLGNILGHQGFEQLNTGAESDEEQALA